MLREAAALRRIKGNAFLHATLGAAPLGLTDFADDGLDRAFAITALRFALQITVNL
jgi:hypothetical protein